MLADRRANDDQFGVGHALGQVDRGVGDGADAAGDPQTDLPAADADDVFRPVPLRKARPIDPPISPTPTMATVSQVSWHFRVGVGRNRGRAAKTAYCSRSLREGRGDRGERQETCKVALERT